MKTSASRLSLVAIANANSSTSSTSSGSNQTEVDNDVPPMSMPRSLTFSSGIESLERAVVEEFASDRDRELVAKCVRLIQFHVPSGPPPTFPGSNLLKPTASGLGGSSSNLLTPTSGASTPDLSSPEKVISLI